MTLFIESCDLDGDGWYQGRIDFTKPVNDDLVVRNDLGSVKFKGAVTINGQLQVLAGSSIFLMGDLITNGSVQILGSVE